MARRTLTNARAMLDSLLPEISDHWAKRFESQYQDAVRRAHTFADTYVVRTADGIDEERRQTLEGLCQLRDDFAALAADGTAGRLGARDYAKRHNDLLR